MTVMPTSNAASRGNYLQQPKAMLGREAPLSYSLMMPEICHTWCYHTMDISQAMQSTDNNDGGSEAEE